MLKFYTCITVLSGLILLIPSCFKDNSNCTVSSSCYTQKIDSGDVHIRVSYQPGQAGVPVILYKGYVEDQQVLWQDTVYQQDVYLYMAVGERYAAEAYYYGSQAVVALDGKKLKNDTHKECGTKCYDFPTVTLDCRKL